ncbi:hypothetical protein [Mycobacterium sp.]|uniref:hypothetical protein n=1 Tax=Mycobacterium sp. TaxID=1785 RepID=UPI003F997462
MTTVVDRRGGPSDLHEYRAATLATMATLTGHTHALSVLPDGSRPDVLQLRPSDDSLFVGDAKATETPGNIDTFARLSRYAAFLAEWVRQGGSGVLALVVSDREAFDWLRVLRDLAIVPSRGIRVRGHVDPIEVGTAVVWQSFIEERRGKRRGIGWRS